MSRVELVVGGAIAGTLTTYLIIFRVLWARGQRAAAVPAAVVERGGDRWVEGQGRQRVLGFGGKAQTGLVALALTSITVMLLCAVAMVAVVVLS
ncbi:MAG: hypothetical protein KBG28_15785 [Kofleriaceae bacterium]|jgi:hypothetical protein|nr:hypothetical protein [Kofleriaceae bacterium]MBP6840648.1 hypothetical protein [Kofleriaceae bacterium]MBP9205432.1 hypothetical protein [Kofleriaceae bacterium]